ncbi:hypothetical protein BD413DRAFT_234390 [Trametes elegans]|nr:hypothetical protein BD413DRAFT_234390 [Trametes elegans]
MVGWPSHTRAARMRDDTFAFQLCLSVHGTAINVAQARRRRGLSGAPTPAGLRHSEFGGWPAVECTPPPPLVTRPISLSTFTAVVRLGASSLKSSHDRTRTAAECVGAFANFERSDLRPLAIQVEAVPASSRLREHVQCAFCHTTLTCSRSVCQHAQ